MLHISLSVMLSRVFGKLTVYGAAFITKQAYPGY